MQIFTLPDNSVIGPFDSIEALSDGNFMAGGGIIPADQVAGASITTVANDYLNPEQQSAAIITFNIQQKKNRFAAYTVESDPIFFKSQRGQATNQQWLDAVAAVDAKFPYKEVS